MPSQPFTLKRRTYDRPAESPGEKESPGVGPPAVRLGEIPPLSSLTRGLPPEHSLRPAEYPDVAIAALREYQAHQFLGTCATCSRPGLRCDLLKLAKRTLFRLGLPLPATGGTKVPADVLTANAALSLLLEDPFIEIEGVCRQTGASVDMVVTLRSRLPHNLLMRLKEREDMEAATAGPPEIETPGADVIFMNDRRTA